MMMMMMRSAVWVLVEQREGLLRQPDRPCRCNAHASNSSAYMWSFKSIRLLLGLESVT